jgi:hypothetical protein
MKLLPSVPNRCTVTVGDRVAGLLELTVQAIRRLLPAWLRQRVLRDQGAVRQPPVRHHIRPSPTVTMQWATRIHHRRKLAKIPEEQHNRESTPQWQWRTDLGCKLPLIENIRSRLRQAKISRRGASPGGGGRVAKALKSELSSHRVDSSGPTEKNKGTEESAAVFNFSLSTKQIQLFLFHMCSQCLF